MVAEDGREWRQVLGMDTRVVSVHALRPASLGLGRTGWKVWVDLCRVRVSWSRAKNAVGFPFHVRSFIAKNADFFFFVDLPLI